MHRYHVIGESCDITVLADDFYVNHDGVYFSRRVKAFIGWDHEKVAFIPGQPKVIRLKDE